MDQDLVPFEQGSVDDVVAFLKVSQHVGLVRVLDQDPMQLETLRPKDEIILGRSFQMRASGAVYFCRTVA
jgi:hypothetical protein